MSKEHLRKLETQSDAILREFHARRTRKHRRLHVTYLNCGEADAADAVGDVRITKCVIKRRMSKDELEAAANEGKPWLKFCRNAHKVLAVLNDEVSSALRDSFSSIDDIQMRIRKTIDEIQECDRMYNHLRARQRGPTPVALKRRKSFGMGLPQYRVDTQMRSVPMPSIKESIYENEPEEVSSQVLTDALIVPTTTPVAGSRTCEPVPIDDLARKLGPWTVRDEPSKIKEVIAEELYVPEKINRIAASSRIKTTTSNHKSCQFLYKEKTTKKRKTSPEADGKKTGAPMKYADSVLFAKRKSNTGESPCSAVVESVGVGREFRTLTLRSVNCKAGLDCYDILDEITLNDLQPLQSEYPRRDNVGVQKPPRPPHITYLHKLVSGCMQDEFLKLLRFEEPDCVEICKLPDSVFKSVSCDKKPQSRKTSKKDRHRRGKRNTDDDIESRLKPYMFDPYIRYPTTVTVMPAMVTTYTNPNFVKNIKALAEKNQVGDCGPKPGKAIKKKSTSHTEKKKRVTNRRDDSTSEKMRGDAWNDFETSSSTTPSPKATKRRTLRSNITTPNELVKVKPSKTLKQKKWEANIQGVIELIESKIVEILANPQKTHFEAFKSVETKILEILSSERGLEVIDEGSQIDFDMAPKRFKTRSKTDTSLLELVDVAQRRTIASATTECLFRKKLTIDESTSTTMTDVRVPSSALLNLVESIPSVTTYKTKTIHYRYRCNAVTVLSIPRLYYQTTKHGTCTSTQRLAVPLKSGPVRDHKTSTEAQKKKTGPKTNDERKKPSWVQARAERIRRRLSHSNLYTQILNYVYFTLFAITFFGLTFNYTC